MSAVGSVPGQVIVATTCVGGLAVLVHYSRLGMWMRAAGSNEPTFRALAVRPRMVIGLAFATGAALAALAGIVESARSEHGDPAANPELLLSGILAALIGGVKLSGGEGTVWYAVRGGLLFALIKEHLEQVGLDPEIRWVLLGVLVVLASLSEFFRRRLIDDRKIL
jgi:ribose/xylose/arabinose/galactoside ABC-type transport system permease subunit